MHPDPHIARSTRRFMAAALGQLGRAAEADRILDETELDTSQQGRASVFITVPFQITTIEFSPSLEIASVVLNSNSKQVLVQLPGAGPSPAEGPPVFEIANLQLAERGEIGMMQLNLLGQSAKET